MVGNSLPYRLLQMSHKSSVSSQQLISRLRSEFRLHGVQSKGNTSQDSWNSTCFRVRGKGCNIQGNKWKIYLHFTTDGTDDWCCQFLYHCRGWECNARGDLIHLSCTLSAVWHFDFHTASAVHVVRHPAPSGIICYGSRDRKRTLLYEQNRFTFSVPRQDASRPQWQTNSWSTMWCFLCVVFSRFDTRERIGVFHSFLPVRVASCFLSMVLTPE